MYILKNAIKNIGRNQGRNILLLLLSISIISMSAASMLLGNHASESAAYYAANDGSKVNILSSSDEPLDNRTLLSFTDSNLLNKSEQRGLIPVLLKDLLAVGTEGHEAALIKWIASSKEEIDETFENGEKKIIDGKKYSGVNEVLISKRLAELNQLHPQDQITITSKDGKSMLTLTIAGIYQNASLQADDNIDGTTYSSHWNEIYTGWETMKSSALFDSSASCSIELYLKDPSLITELRDDLLKKGMPKSYLLSQDLDTYEQKMKPIRQLEDISHNMTLAVIGIGGILLVLISIMAIRERKYEVGVLRSMGMSKSQIAKGFLYESFVITLTALIISLSAASLFAEPLIQMMVHDEGLKAIIHSALTMQNMIDCTLLSLLLALISSAGGLFIIMRYEPRRILSEKD